MPVIDKSVDANMWPISDEGRVAAERLADRLANYSPDLVFSSDEPKAVATAKPISDRLGNDVAIVPGFREHDRRGGRWMSTETFRDKVHRFFDNPSDLVFGHESADDAYSRFRDALKASLEMYSFENAVVVAHGTVITLYVSRLAGVEPFAFWERLGLPSYVVMSWPENRLLEVVDAV
jgi:broad specificity phosphatase PhoE